MRSVNRFYTPYNTVQAIVCERLIGDHAYTMDTTSIRFFNDWTRRISGISSMISVTKLVH